MAIIQITKEEEKKYYELFNLTAETATVKKIRKNYRKSALKNHPDKGGTKEKIQELNKAKDFLINLLEEKNKQQKQQQEKNQQQKQQQEKNQQQKQQEKNQQEKNQQQKNQQQKQQEKTAFLNNIVTKLSLRKKIVELEEKISGIEKNITEENVTITNLTMKKENNKILNFVIKVITFGYYDRNKKIENKLIETKDSLTDLNQYLTDYKKEYTEIETRLITLTNNTDEYKNTLSEKNINEINKIENDFNDNKIGTNNLVSKIAQTTLFKCLHL